MRTLLRTTLTGFVAVVIATVVLGLAYPAAVWGVSRLASRSADGDLVYSGDCLLAARGMADGRGPADPAADSGSAPAGGADSLRFMAGRPIGMTNEGPNSPALSAAINTRRAAIAAREGVDPSQVPVDALTGSASGVDDGISVAYAELQIPRIARENHMREQDVQRLVDAATDGRALGVLGEPVVHVTEVNLALPGATTCTP